jgi:CxxC-x17-CxxC domain-containing protein
MKKFVRGPVKKGRNKKPGRTSRGDSSSFKRRDSSDRSSRDRPSRGRERGSRDRERSSRDRSEMTEVVCDKCKTKCEVPFKPTSDKPVYCSNCFKKGDSRYDSRGGRDSSRGGRDDSKQFEQINEKLDLIMKILNKK